MKHLSILFAMTLLTGCSSMSMNSSFSCGVGDGLGCKSVSEISDIVDSSNIVDGQIIQGSAKEQEKAVYSMLSYYEGASNDKIPEREPEKRLKIWFAPHIDGYDNFVEETVVYAVVKESAWKF